MGTIIPHFTEVNWETERLWGLPRSPTRRRATGLWPALAPESLAFTCLGHGDLIPCLQGSHEISDEINPVHMKSSNSVWWHMVQWFIQKSALEISKVCDDHFSGQGGWERRRLGLEGQTGVGYRQLGLWQLTTQSHHLSLLGRRTVSCLLSCSVDQKP